MNATANIEDDRIEPVVRPFRQLSPGSQGAVAALVRQLAEVSPALVSNERKALAGISESCGTSRPNPMPAPIRKATHKDKNFPQIPSFRSF